IQVDAIDRPRLLLDVTRALADTHVNIINASATSTGDNTATNRFTFEMGDLRHLTQVLKAVRAVDGVYDAYRV
ncbi:MAG: ACT domain-containing protein, partial [Actinomycetes bacterium]